MSRIARVVGLELPHHITQRGNYQQEVFSNDADRKIYLRLLREYSGKYGLKILLKRKLGKKRVGRPKKTMGN